MTFGESAKKGLLIMQIAWLGVCVIFVIILWLSGARPAKSPEMKVTITADQKYKNCLTWAGSKSGLEQDWALDQCAEATFTDTLEPVNP